MEAEKPATAATADNARETYATYAAGLFTNGVWDMLSVVVPLYAVAVGLSVAEIGFIVAARSVLPAALSIHGGILMDRWGTPRVLLWVALACGVLPLLYPVGGWFEVLVVLQLLLGLATGLGMSATQTWALQASGSDTNKLGHFSIASRIGTFLGPVTIGAIWDGLGAWASFVCIALWSAGTVASTAWGIRGKERRTRSRATLRSTLLALVSLLPRWAEHRSTFALAAIPAVAFVLAVSFLRNAPGSIQSSFYVVYLGQIGWSGTIIGLMVSTAELAGVAGSLVAARLERAVHPRRLVLMCLVSSILAISITPLVGHWLVLLSAAAAVRGFGQGLGQPLMYSLLGRAVPSHVHGATVGLRNAVTRFASIVTPAFMGLAADRWGIETSFYIIGAAMIAGAFALGSLSRRVLGR